MAIVGEHQLVTFINGIVDLPNPSIIKLKYEKGEIHSKNLFFGTILDQTNLNEAKSIIKSSNENVKICRLSDNKPTAILLKLKNQEFLCVTSSAAKSFSKNQVEALQELLNSYKNFKKVTQEYELLANQQEASAKIDEIFYNDESSTIQFFNEILNLAIKYLGTEFGFIRCSNGDSFKANHHRLVDEKDLEPQELFQLSEAERAITSLVMNKESLIRIDSSPSYNYQTHAIHSKFNITLLLGQRFSSLDGGGLIGFFSTKSNSKEFTERELQFVKSLKKRIEYFLNRIYRKNKLRKERELLSSFVKSSPAAIAMLDSNMNYLAASDRWIKEYRINRDLVGISHYELFPTVEKKFKDIHSAALQGEEYSGEVRELSTGNGEKQHIRLEVKPWYTYHHEIGGIIIYTADITEIVEQNKKIEIANKSLKESNRLKEQFAYIASHDLKEPVRTISSLAHSLTQRYTDKIDERGQKLLQYIEESASRMTGLIDGLLEYSRLGTTPELSEIDLNKTLEIILIDLNTSIQEHHAYVHIDSLPRIIGYRTEIRLLFQNLIANAIKFHLPEETPQITVGYEENRDHWRFFVKDQGMGIPDKEKEKIFILFRRSHDRKKYEGSGIGLARCYRIAELHGGQIWVQDNKPKGSIFYFTISKELF